MFPQKSLILSKPICLFTERIYLSQQQPPSYAPPKQEIDRSREVVYSETARKQPPQPFQQRQELLQEEKIQKRQIGPRVAQVRVAQQRQKEHWEAFLQRTELGWEQKNVQRGSVFPKVPQQKVVWQSQVPTYSPIPDEYTLVPDEKALAESVTFYTNLGFPQFGGKYAPFEYPLGAWFGKPESIVETPEGLEVTFKPYTTSVAETKVFVPLSRWSELKDFGQDIANVKANAGTSSLARDILALQTQIPEAAKKYGLVGLGSPTAGLERGGYGVAAFERLYNPYAPSLVEGLTSGKQALVGTLVGEAVSFFTFRAIGGWMMEGTPSPTPWLKESVASVKERAQGLGHKAMMQLIRENIGEEAYQYYTKIEPLTLGKLLSPVTSAFKYELYQPIAEAFTGTAKALLGTQAYEYGKQIIAPNIGQIARETLGTVKGRFLEAGYQTKQLLPESFQEAYSLAKTVYAPNILSSAPLLGLEKVWKPTLSYVSEFMPNVDWAQAKSDVKLVYGFIYEPYVEAKAIIPSAVSYKFETAFKGVTGKLQSIPSLTLSPETRAFNEALKGRLRYILKVPVKGEGYTTSLAWTFEAPTPKVTAQDVASTGLLQIEAMPKEVTALRATSKLSESFAVPILMGVPSLMAYRGKAHPMGKQEATQNLEEELLSLPTSRADLKAATRLASVSTTALKAQFKSLSANLSLSSLQSKSSSLQSLKQEGYLIQRTSQTEKQMQKQVQKQAQQLMGVTLQKQTWPFLDQEPKRKSDRKRKGKGDLLLVGRQKRFYPVADVKEFTKKMMG
jgi:hypothetical protein